MRHNSATQPDEDDYRQRLLDGMAAAIIEKGYAETTIADIVRHARVSKRTFYEYFPDKQSCLLACYTDNHSRVIRAIKSRSPSAENLSWDKRLLQGLRDFLDAGESQLTLMSTLMVEIMAAGREGLRARREVFQRFTDLLLDIAENERQRCGTEVQVLTPPMASALIGGIHEIMLNACEDSRGLNVKNLADRLADFIVSASTALGSAQLLSSSSGRNLV